MIGLWCNGSTTGFGSVCPSSNLGSPTKKSPERDIFRGFFFFVDAKSLLKSLERSHTEQQHDDFYSLVAKTEEDALKKYLSIRM
jgi:hypothetical protein